LVNDRPISYQKVSIQLVSPASGDGGLSYPRNQNRCKTSFHSISFPSEWGRFDNTRGKGHMYVSIQLVSPASGDTLETDLLNRLEKARFPFN